jgi:hypothetical protein
VVQHRILWSIAFLTVAITVATGACSTDSVTRDLGARCDTDSDCNGRCLPDPRWPGGMCSRDCIADNECPVTTSVCVHTPVDGQACAFACLDDRDCMFLDSTVGGPQWTCQSIDNKLICAGPP